MQPAACVIVPTGNSPEEIFAISRRNDFTQWGIPGGKQEDNESNLNCAHREINEECGLILDNTRLLPIYSGVCHGKDGRDFWVTTYLYEGTYSNEIIAEDEFQVKPMELTTLCDEAVSPFAAYNRSVLAAWRSYK